LPGVKLLHPVDANEVFVEMAEAQVAALERQFKFYRWPLHGSDEGVAIRLVTSYATPAADVDAFVSAAQRLSG
jgi:threonine aldolase